MTDNEQILQKIEELTAKVDGMDRKIEAVNQTVVFNTNALNEFILKVSQFWEIIKRSEMKRLGLTNKQVGLPRIDDDAIIAYSKQGYTNKAIAAALGCNEQTVIDHKKRLKAQGKL